MVDLLDGDGVQVVHADPPLLLAEHHVRLPEDGKVGHDRMTLEPQSTDEVAGASRPRNEEVKDLPPGGVSQGLPHGVVRIR